MAILAYDDRWISNTDLILPGTAVQNTAGGSGYLHYGALIPGAFPVTVAVWARGTTAGVNYIPFSVSDVASTNRYANINFSSDTNVYVQLVNTTARARYSAKTWTPGVWHHICAQWISSSSQLIYVDGIEGGTNSATGTSGWPTLADNTTIGATLRSSLVGSSGAAAHCAVWSAVLPNAEVQQLAAGLHPLALQHRVLSLLAYWPLNQGSPREYRGRYDMTLQGDALFVPFSRPDGNLVMAL